ncbi:MAG: hypothetical protein D6689_03985 [Deltaproteobacteria bacterium]|nr:MAG: hypothetical protein D6689_03985 [Deltaproteobacteria bacterium]
MRSALVATTMALAAWGCERGTANATNPPGDSATVATSADQLFSLDRIARFDLTLDERAIASLEAAPRRYVEGVFAYGGVTYERVAVRLKGHRAMQSFDGKPAFKIHFGKWHKGRRFLGLKALTLNNMVEDPTMMREVIAYRLFREAGVPVPRAGYATLYVNGEYYGLYANIETVDKRFVKHHIGAGRAPVFEGEYGCDLYPDDVPGFEIEVGDDRDRAALAALAADPLAGIDRERVLAYLATSAAVGDFDGYRHAHNYRVVRDPATKRWAFIPWGLDRTFKQRLSVYDSGGLVAKLCFADAGCRAEYARAVRAVAERMAAVDWDEQVRRIAARIDTAVIYDPRKPYSLHDTRRARAALRAYLRERPAALRAEVACIGPDGSERDGDGDGFGCTDCDDARADVHPGAQELCGDGVDNDCSGDADDAPACGCDAVEVEGARFELCVHRRTWDEAAAFCAARGGALARVDSDTQAWRLWRKAQRRAKAKWWIGLTDRAEEGVFAWADGSPVTFTAWNGREPDNDACNQDCAAMGERAQGRWHDTHCASRLPFVCRLP